jgi:sugar phosphate permease
VTDALAAAPARASSSEHHPVRWVMAILVCLIVGLYFLDKGSMSVAAPFLSRELGFSKADMGLIFSILVIGDGLTQLPGGWLCDKFGPRRVLSIMLSGWSLMMMLTGLSSTFLSICLARFGQGIFEGGSTPGGATAVRRWFPPTELGIVTSLPTVTGRLAGVLVPMVGVTIILHMGWRAMFYVFGGAGLICAAAFYLIYRDSPEQHSWVAAGLPAPCRADVPAVTPWRTILRSPTVGGLCVAHSAYYYSIYFFTTWLPTYLLQYRHASVTDMATYTTVIFVAGMVGGIAGGIVSDRILIATGRLTLARKAVAASAFLFSGMALIPVSLTGNVPVAVGFLCVSMFFLQVLIGPEHAICIEVGGKFAGTITGFMNAVSAVAGALSPMVFGFLAEGGHWVAPFSITTGMCAAAALAWVFLVRPGDKSILLAK